MAIISSFMQNIGAAALFLPSTMRISRQLNISASRILMPMGFWAITGGWLTLVRLLEEKMDIAFIEDIKGEELKPERARCTLFFLFLSVMLVIALLTSFFSLVASNVGATVLKVPLAMNMAANLGVSPITAAVVVGLSASNTFILPMHQVNALIMHPGRYKTIDYMRAGTGATIIHTIILIVGVTLFFE